MGIRPEGGNHAPVRNVVHRISDTVKEVDQSKEPYEVPTGKLRVESGVNNKGSGKDADYKPGFVFAPAGPGSLDDIPHDRVIESIKHTGADHDSGYSSELSGIQPAGKENEGKDKICKKVVNHVAADCAEGEHDQVPFQIFFVFHSREILSKSVFLWYAVSESTIT